MTEYAVIDGQRVALTEWFTDKNPARPGVYESGSGLIPWYRWFDGSHWYAGSSDPDDAAERYELHCIRISAAMWRGLSHPPGAT